MNEVSYKVGCFTVAMHKGGKVEGRVNTREGTITIAYKVKTMRG